MRIIRFSLAVAVGVVGLMVFMAACVLNLMADAVTSASRRLDKWVDRMLTFSLWGME